MNGGMNLAAKYSRRVDERFTRESQAMLALNSDYEFHGAKTVKVYSLPVVPMGDYQRSGAGRYGSPTDLGRNVQVLTVNRDRSFTFIIDKGDKAQSQMVSDAGRALSRQLREAVVPEFDSYVYRSLAAAAKANGAYSEEPITAQNAYASFLLGMERLGDANVPDKGRVAFCTYRFANYLKQDPAFMRYGDKSQELLQKGVIGEVDGCKIVKVPSGRMPAGAAFLLTHSVAATAPRQLEEYKIHEDPPGISGWLVEGRFVYDCFVLHEKSSAVYYHGGQGGLKRLQVLTAAAGDDSCELMVNGEKEGTSRYYTLAASLGALPAVTAGTALTLTGWTQLTQNAQLIMPDEGDTVVCVAELDAAGKPIAMGTARLNLTA